MARKKTEKIVTISEAASLGGKAVLQSYGKAHFRKLQERSVRARLKNKKNNSPKHE